MKKRELELQFNMPMTAYQDTGFFGRTPVVAKCMHIVLVISLGTLSGLGAKYLHDIIFSE